MLNCWWVGSTSCRSTSAELGSFFFEPLQLHLQTPDLFVQLGDLGFITPPVLARAHEQTLGAIDQATLWWICDGCTLNWLASSLTVCTSLTADSATFALNPAP